MEKLMITNCAADTQMHPGVPKRFADSEVLAKSVEAGWRAGACIAHIHAPATDFAAWESHTKAIRDRCDIMLQYGISTQNLEQRRAVVKNRPEMMSVAVCPHNLAFLTGDMMMLHPRQEIADMMRLCGDNGVKPEFEVFGLGELWMIQDLLEKNLVTPPLLMTIFFGRPGGSWSPPTIEEFLHRVSALPKDTFFVTSVTGPTHLTLETMAVLKGGHVRVGTEDEPYLRPGVLGDNPDHVGRIARISKDLNREVATVIEAKALLKIPPR
jgi:3-keto-5-aminohexanoate cleavage enzyme